MNDFKFHRVIEPINTKDEIDDIEDLISERDGVSPKELHQNGNGIRVVARNKGIHRNGEIVNGVSSNVPGTQCLYIKTWGCAHNSSDSEYMAGQLVAYGYKLTTDKMEANLWLLNSCTVKNPAEDHFRNEIQLAQKLGKYVVVAGCVPQGAPKAPFVKGLSVVGVQQIDRVVEVVEETLKGNTVKLLGKKKENGRRTGGASLQLPKVRRNPLIEIIAINTGCLNQCTYCKTKHARGELASYLPDEIVSRAQQAFNEGVVEIWLTSEDTGTYGRDIGTSLPQLLWRLVEIIPKGCRLRLGMTNPPYILEHLEEMAKIMAHPNVYAFMHVPVQSGSDQVLSDMKREYCRQDFEQVVDFLQSHVPGGCTVATDIICGFPTETDADFEETMELCAKYKFPSLFINQFFPRPGTPAALLPRIPAQQVKQRTKRLTELFHSYQPYSHRIGQIQDILVTEISSDQRHFVGHNKNYEQVLIPMDEKLMGKLVTVHITKATKFSMTAEAIDEKMPGLKSPLVKGEVSGLELRNDSLNLKLLLPLIFLFVSIIIKFLWVHI